MSKRTSKAEKRDIILAIFHESRGADRVWILKDLEKAAKCVCEASVLVRISHTLRLARRKARRRCLTHSAARTASASVRTHALRSGA